jgi:hypothetical protein
MGSTLNSLFMAESSVAMRTREYFYRFLRGPYDCHRSRGLRDMPAQSADMVLARPAKTVVPKSLAFSKMSPVPGVRDVSP